MSPFPEFFMEILRLIKKKKKICFAVESIYQNDAQCQKLKWWHLG